MGSEVGYAAHGIALDFDVRRQHLADQGRQTAKLDDEDLVLRYRAASASGTVTGHRARLTVDCKVPQGSARSALHFDIRALKQE